MSVPAGGAEGAEGVAEQGDGMPEIDEWLSENKLTSIAEIFKERDVTFAELTEFDEKDLKEFAADLGLDTLGKRRFVRGIQKLQPSKPGGAGVAVSNTASSSAGSSRSTSGLSGLGRTVVSVVVSPEERRAISRVFERHAALEKVFAEVRRGLESLDNVATTRTAEVEQLFGTLVAGLEAKKDEMMQAMQKMKDEKKNKLQRQLTRLEGQNERMLAVKKRYDERVSNQSLNPSLRKRDTASDVRELMSEQMEEKPVTKSDMQLVFDMEKNEEFLESFLVHGCDVPNAPKLIIGKATYSTVEIEWEDAMNDSSNSAVMTIEYEIAWAVLKKPSKGKKKKKKKRRKKRRKYSSDDSDDSDDESDSDSESDSDESEDSDDSRSKRKRKKKRRKHKKDDSSDEEKIADADKLDIDPEDFSWETSKRRASKGTSWTIKKLKFGYTYAIRIRAKNQSGWGEYCVPQAVELKYMKLVWNRNIGGQGCQFRSKNTRVTYPTSARKVVTDYVIRLKDHKKFMWEITCHMISNYSWIGFVKAPLTTYCTNWNQCLGSNSHDCVIGFQINMTSIPRKQNGQQQNLQTSPVQIGDKFRFLVRGHKKTVEVFHNKRSLGVCFTNVHDEIVPCCSNNSQTADYTIKFIG